MRRALTSIALAALLACRTEQAPDSEKYAAGAAAAQPGVARAAEAPAPPPKTAPEPAAQHAKAAPARDITVPPPDVDVHVINGRNILSAPLDEPAAAAAPSAKGGAASERVRVTFWTTPDGQKLAEPQQFEGALADLDLGIGDLPMLSPGHKRRIWIPGPTGMATLDVELLVGTAQR